MLIIPGSPVRGERTLILVVGQFRRGDLSEFRDNQARIRFLDFVNREQLFDGARVFHTMNLTSAKLRLYSGHLPPDGAL